MQAAPQGGFTTTFTPYRHPFPSLRFMRRTPLPSISLFFKGLKRIHFLRCGAETMKRLSDRD
ncbi:hypothetical protein HMPREF1322_1315 [Porphyromonas gingivalis W50]|nr:hypothetical protein HMPREF1322_1315 [Porphyromonas gingivalis W50]